MSATVTATTATPATTVAAPETEAAVEQVAITPEGAQLRVRLYRLIDQMSDEKVATLIDFLTIPGYHEVDPRDVDIKPVAFDDGTTEEDWMDCDEEGFYDDYDESEVDPRDLGVPARSFEGDRLEGYKQVAEDEEDRKEAEEWINGTVQIFED